MSEPAQHIVISANAYNDIGGMFVLEDGRFSVIDALPTGALASRGDAFYRLTHTRTSQGAELLEYDATGISHYHRIDTIGGPHDLLCVSDERLLCAASQTNEIFQIAGDGTARSVWSAGAPPDAWHLNCMTLHEGRLYATAFGAFATAAGWAAGCERTGFLFEVATGERILQGLTKPHTPRYVDGAWTICDSGTQAFVRFEPDGRTQRVELGGFVRGTLVRGDVIYVGVGLPRAAWTDERHGFVAVLDRATLAILDEISLMTDSIYDIVSVSDTTLAALRTGFRFGSARESIFGQLAMFEQVGVTPTRFWAISDKLPVEDVRARIVMDFPERVAPGSITTTACRVTNLGASILTHSPPNPIFLCYRWFDADLALVGEGTWIHTPLYRALPPREERVIEASVQAPDRPGTFTLRMTLLQANVWWFDDVDPANAAVFSVRVEEEAEPVGRAAASGEVRFDASGL
jgi:hypothetical protein